MVQQQSNHVLRPDPDHGPPAKLDICTSGTDGHRNRALVCPGYAVWGASTGEVGVQAPGSFAITEICVAGECEVSWEWPFYWAADAVE